MEPERIELSARERDRLKVLHEVEQGHLKQIEAARRPQLTDLLSTDGHRSRQPFSAHL